MDRNMDFLVELVERGIFGKNCQLRGFKLAVKPKSPHLHSTIDFVDVRVEDKSKAESVTFSVVVKRPTSGVTGIMAETARRGFSNELIMYKEILPELKAEALFARLYEGCFYGDDRLINSYLVFEDLSLGHKSADFPMFLDYAHLSVAVNALGKFHGLSYLEKSTGVDLNKLCEKLADASMGDNDNFEVIVNGAISRVLKDDDFIEKDLAIRLLKNTRKLKSLNESQEPFAVVCHGDFFKNNIYFEYTDNKPTGVKFYDLQMSRYNDPVVDLGYFLYMNSCEDIRDSHWFDILASYWDGVTRTAPKPGFTREQCYDNISMKILSAIRCVAFSLPFQMSRASLSCFSKSDAEISQCIVTAGGNEEINAVRHVLYHMERMGYLRKGLERIESNK